MTEGMVKKVIAAGIITIVTPMVWVMGWLMERAQWVPEEDE